MRLFFFILITTLILIRLNLSIALSAEKPQPSPTPTKKGPPPQFSIATHPCQKNESWTFSEKIPKDFQITFEGFLDGKIKPSQSFAEAFALRRFAKNDEAKLFAEYWISRSFFEMGLTHIAWGGFSTTTARPSDFEKIGIQLASLACQNQIQHQYPTFTFPSATTTQLPLFFQLAKTQNDKEILWNATNAQFRLLIQDKEWTSQAEKLLPFLKGSGAYEHLAQGLWAALHRNHKNTIKYFEEFFKIQNLPASLKRYQDIAHLFTARAYYSLKKFEAAALQFKAVSKNSNELADTLSELAWSQLMQYKYGDAIGTAINLQSGGLRNTFAPESPMIMAIATNELCQYPDSIQAIRIYQKHYEKTYRWLSQWNKTREKLYPLAIRYLKRDPNIPGKVGGEWIRSPLFISHQDEINLILDEKEAANRFTALAQQDQKRIIKNSIRLLTDLKLAIKIIKSKKKPGDPLPKSFTDDLAKLRKNQTHLRRLFQAAPIWKNIYNNHRKQMPARQNQLIAAMNRELEMRSDRMLLQMDEVMENMQLIEVEIYNGATHDIIWQNAHPDYQKIAAQMQEETETPPESTWNWGQTNTDAEDGEVWEDELGSFKAKLFDNCSSKSRYLSIKMKGKK